MPKGPKGFSEIEKEDLKTKLCAECERSWATYGYKKTSIGELTTKIGISTGSFYLLYNSKEDLFCDSLARIQERLKATVQEFINPNNGKAGFIKSLKWTFKEYNRLPFLYDTGAPDFLSFINKLPKDRVEELKFDNVSFFNEMITRANLTLKVDKEKAFAVISTLLYGVALKERLNYDSLEVFDFLLDSVIDELFE